MPIELNTPSPLPTIGEHMIIKTNKITLGILIKDETNDRDLNVGCMEGIKILNRIDLI
jgi:hypothetical protein